MLVNRVAYVNNISVINLALSNISKYNQHKEISESFPSNKDEKKRKNWVRELKIKDTGSISDKRREKNRQDDHLCTHSLYYYRY